MEVRTCELRYAVIARKKKNVLDYKEIMDYFQDTDFEADRMEKVFEIPSCAYSNDTTAVLLDVGSSVTRKVTGAS